MNDNRVRLQVAAFLVLSTGAALLSVRQDTSTDVLALLVLFGATFLLLPFHHPWRYVAPLVPVPMVLVIGAASEEARLSWDELWAPNLLALAFIQIVLLVAVTNLRRKRHDPT